MNYLIILIIVNQIFAIKSSVQPKTSDTNLKELADIFVDNLFENYDEADLSAEISATEKTFLDMKFEKFLHTAMAQANHIHGHSTRSNVKSRKKRLISNLAHVNHDDGVYILEGFKDIASIPIDFPKDVCLFQVNDNLFAAGLTQNQTDQQIYLQFFKENNGQYELTLQYQTNSATDMDCITSDNKGYVAVVNIIKDTTELDPLNGSPVFEITENSIKIIQMLRAINLKSIRLWTYGKDMYLMKAFNAKTASSVNTVNNLVQNLHCLVYKWMGYHFDKIDELACNHPMHIEPFVIRTDIYIAIADYMDDYGSTDTFSHIYKYDFDADKFFLMQKIKSKGAIDIKYFHLETDNNHHEHFLIVANSIDMDHHRHDDDDLNLNYETQSVIYKFVQGSFIPSQQLQFYKISKFLPVVGTNNKFSLLVACENQEVQVYQYDGWKFTKSTSYSTGDVFGKGITSMRSIVVNNTNLVVIANENLNAEYFNIFEPLYTFKNDLNLLQKEVHEWCEASYKVIENYDVKEYLRIIEELPKEHHQLEFKAGITFYNVTIKNVVTKTLTTPKATLDTEFFNNVSRIHKKANYIQTKLNNFANIPGESQLGIQFEEDSTPENTEPIDQMVFDNFSEIENLNGFPTDSLLFTTDELNLNNLVLKNDCYAMRGLTVQNKIDSIKFNTSNVLLKHGQQVFTGLLRIKNLTVDKLRTKMINDFPIVNPTNSGDSFELERNNTIRKLVVKKLTVHGLLNGRKMQYLYENSLKVKENQVITGLYLIEQLSGDQMHCNQLISGLNASDLIPIDRGDFKINQDIQFADGVQVNNLIVTQRINNIKVVDGKLDVLLTESTEQQVIYGDKIFENVKLLEPILLHGKIKSKNFENINPIVTVDESLILDGDYIINGDVTIRKVLRSNDMYGQGSKYGVNYLHEHGLLLNSTSSNLKFNFTQGIRTGNLNVDLINERYFPKDFVKLDSNEIQEITGQVIVKNDLYIDGLCQVGMINNIDIATLNSSILRRTGNQIIEGTIHIDEILVDHCTAADVTIGADHKLEDFLYFPSEILLHTLPFAVTLDGNLNVTDSLHVQHLTTNSKINGFDFEKLIGDTAQTGQTITVTGAKFFENDVIIENLTTKGSVFGMNVNETVNNDAPEEIVYDGNAIFTGDEIFIDKLVVHGYINGVVAGENFGTQWLLSEYDQNITGKITVDELVFLENADLKGRLNKRDLNYIMENCLMIDRVEHLNYAIFKDGIISLNNTEVHGLIGGVNVSNIILSESETVQEISNGLSTDSMVQVENNIYIDNTINNLAIKNLKAFIAPETYNVLTEGVIINGSCTFPSEPQIEYLNDYNIDQLYHYAWMMNEGKMISVPLTFENVELHDEFQLTGLLNGRNLTLLAQNYFSLSRPQHVSTLFEINGNVTANGPVNFADVMLDGEIYGHTSKKGVNLNYYDKYALKFGVEQVITGEWTIDEVHIFGDLPDIPINGFKIPENVVFEEKGMINITSKKTFRTVNAHSLVCPYPCIVQNVNIIDWINNAVDQNADNVINGSLTLEEVHIDTLETPSRIGNISFNSENLLTKSTDQVIDGTLTIVPSGQNEETTLIENVQAQDVNGISLDFLDNIAMDNDENVSINSKVVFVEPVTILKNMEIESNFFGVDLTVFSEQNRKALDDFQQLNEKLSIYDNLIKKLSISNERQAYYVRYFIHRQTITGEIVKIITISLIYNQNNDKRHCIAMLELTDKWPAIHFYRYSAESNAIIRDEIIKSITFKESAIIEISCVRLSNVDMLYIESIQNNTIKHSLLAHNANHGFQHAHEFADEVLQEPLAFTLSNRDCVLFYSHDKDANIYCASELVRPESKLEFYQTLEKIRIKQAIAIPNNIYVSIAVLTMGERVEIWIENNHKKLSPYEIIDVSDPISLTGISYKKFSYIAIASTTLNSSIHVGSIEIYRAPVNGSFYHFQTVTVKLPKTIEFSVLQNGDLLLCAMTDDPINPLIIYEYAGVVGFRSLVHEAKLPRGDSLTMYSNREHKKDFIVIKANENALMVEVVMNKKFG